MVCALSTGAFAAEQPVMPQAFYGTVETAGNPAEIGILIEVSGTGVRNGVDGNPIPVTINGLYGGPDSYDKKLIVQGSIAPGTTLEFYVGGVRAEVSTDKTTWTETYPFSSGTTSELHLRIDEIVTPVVTTTATVTTTTTTSATPTATYTYSGSSSGGGGGGGGGTSYSFPSSASAKTSTVTATPTARSTGMENPTQPVITEMQTQETAPPALEQVPQENEPVSTGQPGQPWTIFGIPGMWVVGLIGAIVIVNVSVIGILKLRQGRE